MYPDLIINNLKKLDISGSNILIRVPIIPGFNDSHQDMIHFVHLIKELRNTYPV
jgi:pyruvate-formate lyase-activating enzyme